MSEYPRLDQIRAVLGSQRIPTTTEERMQAKIWQLLEASGLRYGREVALGSGPGGHAGRIDFTVRADIGLVGIECKTQGGPMEFARQLIRYGITGQLQALVLFSARPVSLPIRSVNYTAPGGKAVEIPVYQWNPPTL